MDPLNPLTAAFNLLTAVTNTVNTLMAKASPGVVDAILQEHLDRQKRIDALMHRIATKVGLGEPVPVPATTK